LPGMDDDTPPAPGDIPSWYYDTRQGYYDPDGRPISPAESVGLLSDLAVRRVALTFVPQPDGTHAEVSTVYHPFDYGFIPGGPPVLWESMVFGADRGGRDMRRYSSRAAAEIGHAEMVAEWMPGRADLARYRRVVKARQMRAQRARRRARRAGHGAGHKLPPGGYGV
jgi:hypothetical protein